MLKSRFLENIFKSFRRGYFQDKQGFSRLMKILENHKLNFKNILQWSWIGFFLISLDDSKYIKKIVKGFKR